MAKQVEAPLQESVSSPRGWSNSELLRGKIELVSARGNGSIPSLLTHPRLAEFYPEVLLLLHGMLRANVPLMQAALARARALADEDAVAALLVDYLDEHILEETGHDEWLLQDLELLGVSRDQVLRRIPSLGIIEAVGAQYYWINHVHPVAFLGYLEALEGKPVPIDAVEYAMKHSGLPPDVFRTVLIHAQNDPAHSADLDRLIDSLPLQAVHSAMLGICAMAITAAVDEAYGAVLEPYMAGAAQGG